MRSVTATFLRGGWAWAQRYAALVLCVFAAACAGTQVTVDYDPSANLAAYRTYAWAPPGGVAEGRTGDNPAHNSPIMARRVHDAVGYYLQQRGYKETDAAHADFWVATYLVVRDRARVRSLGPGYGYYSYGRTGYWPAYPYTYVENYEEGSVVLDIISTKTKELVWRGVSRERLAENPTPDEITADIYAAVNDILERFPPPPRPE